MKTIKPKHCIGALRVLTPAMSVTVFAAPNADQNTFRVLHLTRLSKDTL